MGTMLILKGIHSLLHQEPAEEYAKLMGYVPEVLDVSGEAYDGSPQVLAALKRIHRGGVTALYGFSGGGYNTVHIFKHLSEEDRSKIERIVILGSPGVVESSFPGVKIVTIYHNADREVPHMELPDQFLKEQTA